MKKLRFAYLLIMLLAATAILQHGFLANSYQVAPTVLAGQQRLGLEALIPELLGKRVIFIGESHSRYDHHLNQLAVIRRLYEADPRLAIGLEMIQQPFQRYLDAYIAGNIGERDLLEKTEYFQRWGFDYRLYRPIFRYAKEQGIPMIALNVPQEISRRVGQVGIAGLNDEERTWMPDQIDKSDKAYRDRLKQVFEAHEGLSSGSFEHFLEAQLLWDEAMAARAAHYLKKHPGQRLVILAGEGHLAYGSGIPQRVLRRIPVESAIVLQREEETADDEGADYLLLSPNIPLPPAGRLGVMLATSARGLTVQNVVPDSGAQKAGIQQDDRIVDIGGQPVQSMEDVRLALLDKIPGDSIEVIVQRAEDQQLAFSVTLQH